MGLGMSTKFKTGPFCKMDFSVGMFFSLVFDKHSIIILAAILKPIKASWN